jgi:hypothetical protein
MRHVRVLLAPILLAASICCAFETDYSLATRDPNAPPRVFLRAELVSAGGGVFGWWDDNSHFKTGPLVLMSMPYVGVEFNRARAGFGLLSATPGAVSFLPISAGYTIYERPIRYWGRLYGKVPEVYAQATAYLFNWDDPPPDIPFVGTLELVGAVDCFGVGISAEVGGAYQVISGYGAGWPASHNFYPLVGAQVHLPLARLGF